MTCSEVRSRKGEPRMRTLQDLLQIMVGPQVPRSLPHGRAREATEQHYVRPVAVCVRSIVGVRACTRSSFALRCGVGKDCLKGPSGGPRFMPGQTQPLHSINYGSARAFHCDTSYMHISFCLLWTALRHRAGGGGGGGGGGEASKLRSNRRRCTGG